VAHLALRDQIVERTQRFLDRHQRIAVVQLEQIDVIATQAREAGFRGADDVRAAEADVVLAGAGAQSHLGRDQQPRLVELEVGQHLSDDDFRLALRVRVGAVDQVDALVDRRGDEVPRLRAIQAGDFAPDAAAGTESPYCWWK